MIKLFPTSSQFVKKNKLNVLFAVFGKIKSSIR